MFSPHLKRKRVTDDVAASELINSASSTVGIVEYLESSCMLLSCRRHCRRRDVRRLRLWLVLSSTRLAAQDVMDIMCAYNQVYVPTRIDWRLQ